MKAPKVSIIIPCWRHKELTRDIVFGIEKTRDVDFELILVDNGESIPRDLKKHPWLRIVTPGENLGFGGGNNFGAQQAKGDILLFLNSDVEIHKADWINILLSKYDENTIVGTELIKDNNYTRVHGKVHWYVNGWCMMMSKKFFESVGGFDLNFGLGWFEDVWICQQALQKGMKLDAIDCGIQHLGSKTIMDGTLDTNPMMIKAGYYFRDRIVRSLYQKPNMRIVFMCQGNYKFSDATWEGKGTGGAEASLILLTRELAKLGHRVEVYNMPEQLGEQSGVIYHKISEFRYSDYCDAFICFRNPIGCVDQINSPCKIFFSCDQYTVGNFNHNVFPYYDKVVCISEFHKKYFETHYTSWKEGQIEVIGLGVQLADYEKPVVKKKHKVIFCSVPHRGLYHVLDQWDKLRVFYPDLELYITSDYTLWGGNADDESYRERAAKSKGIHYLGKIGREELVKHQMESELMVYPCVYDENFCISAAECIAAGAVPVVMKTGALGTTVGKSGVMVKKDDVLGWAGEVMRLLGDEPARKKLEKAGIERSKKDFNWAILAKQWEEFLYSNIQKNMIDLISRLPDKPAKLSILDLGCGRYESGISEQIPLINFKEYWGVDIWDRDLGVASKHAMVTEDVTYERSDIVEFCEKNKEERWDTIFLFDVVEHLKKPDAIRLLKLVEGMATKRILIFMPIGKGTLEANDPHMAQYKNPYQKHLSEWSVDEWRKLGYDVELLEGFHHSGKLDAAWIYKDTKYMVKCKTCGTEFRSSYFLGRHAREHANPSKKEQQEVPMAADIPQKMPAVKMTFSRKVELSVNSLSIIRQTEAIIEYDQIPDVTRILTEAYGDSIIVSQEFVAE